MIGVSGDDLSTQESFCKEAGAPFPMVGDPEGKILEAFGVSWPLLDTSRRATFVIDGEGTIRARILSEVLIRRHIDRALEAVQALAAPQHSPVR